MAAMNPKALTVEELRAQVLATTGVEEKVEVNQRHLIDKILARYSAKYTVFRELLQNSNDAGARCVEIHFDGAKKTGLMGKERCTRVQVRNNGRVFATEDWHRLKKIAEGNPDEQKIGFFGVGFYSLFSICEGPFVSSGQECMAFFWKGDQLFAKRAPVPGDTTSTDGAQWTTFLMDMREPLIVPDREEFGRFLAASISFTASLLQVRVFVNEQMVLSLEKQMGTPRPIQFKEIPGLQLRSPQRMFSLESVDVRQIHMQSIKGNGSAATATGSTTDANTTSVFLRVASAHLSVRVTKQQTRDMERTTKKNPPATTAVQMIYAGYDEHGASVPEKSGSSILGGNGGDIFSDIMPFPDQGKVYIGFPTHQTTGFSSHVAAHFIPTVERESIDFVDPCLASWNEDLLSMCGLLARILYEDEMNTVARLYQDLVASHRQHGAGNGGVDDEATASARTFLESRAIHAMQAFTYRPSTPSELVGELGAHHFFASTGMHAPHVISTHGVLPANRVKLADKRLVGFVKTVPTIPSSATGASNNSSEFLDKLKLIGYLLQMSGADVLVELERRRQNFTLDELEALMRWWLQEKQHATVDYARRILTLATLPNGRTFSESLSFLNPQLVPPTMPLPATVIDYELTRRFKPSELTNGFGPWSSLSIVVWLAYVAAERPELETDPVFAESILSTISRAWTSSPSSVRSSLTTIVKNRRCIPTQSGMALPGDVYFKHVTLFADLPLVATGKQVSDAFLSDLGVRKHVDLQVIFSRQHDLNWDHVKLVKYLVSIQTTLTDDEQTRLRLTAFFPREEPAAADSTVSKEPSESTADAPAPKRHYSAGELYVPQDNIRSLGLPVIQWPGKLRSYSEEGKLLEKLGLRAYPPLDVLLEIAATAKDLKMRDAALEYFTSNFNSYYRTAYRPDVSTAFLPCADGAGIYACPKDCYLEQSCTVMDFHVLRPDLRIHADKLGVLHYPTAHQLSQRLQKKPPTDIAIARSMFEFLAGRQSDFSSRDITILQKTAFIPIIDKDAEVDQCRLATPLTCYFHSEDQSQHAGFFDYVDFGSIGNSFLRLCGVRSEPTAKDLAKMLAHSPHAFLKACNGYEPYLNTLRQLAVQFDKISSDRALVAQLRRSPFLLGTRRVQDKNEQTDIATVSTDPSSATEKSESPVEYELASAKDIYLINDTIIQQIFSPLSAPMEPILEKFYESLGSAWITNCSKESYVRKGAATFTPVSTQLEILIKERAPLFFYDYRQNSTNTRVIHNSSWLKRKLVVYESPEIAIQYTFTPTGAIETRPTSACVDTGGGRCNLYMTRANFDSFDAARALGRVLFAECPLNDTLLLSTLLSSSLESLRRMGFPVERVLAAKPTPALPSSAQRDASDSTNGTLPRSATLSEKQMEQAMQQLKHTFPDCDSTYLQEQLARETDNHVQRIANRLISKGYPKEQPKVISEQDEYEKALEAAKRAEQIAKEEQQQRLEQSKSLFGRLSRQFMPWQGYQAVAADTQQPVATPPPPPPPQQPAIKPIDPNTTHRLRTSLKSAIDSCRSYSGDSLQSEGTVRQVTESAISYCDSTPAQRLRLMSLPNSQQRLPLYVDKSIQDAAILDNTALMQALRCFSDVLTLIAKAFQLDINTLHIFYDTNGAVIAFNQLPTRALFFNLRYYEALHFSTRSVGTSGKDGFATYVYWFMTVCHELAHNFCREHSSQHEYYMSSFAEQYFGALVIALGQTGVAPQ